MFTPDETQEHVTRIERLRFELKEVGLEDGDSDFENPRRTTRLPRQFDPVKVLMTVPALATS